MTSPDGPGHPDVSCSDEVRAALDEGRPVVALETTIFSHLGLPSPANGEALTRCLDAIATAGAVPALTAVLDGVARVGLAEAEQERVLGPATKTAERDLGVAVGAGWEFGATTVSASVTLAAAVGIDVFATGGIGGVHRGAGTTGDVSADLGAIARQGVVTVCAGAKIFLDLAATLEYLETLSVPVLGFETDEFPAFYTPHSGLAVPQRVDGVVEAAAVLAAHRRMVGTGAVLAVPIPSADALDAASLHRVMDAALEAAEAEGVTGAAITPFVLARLASATDGDSIPANLALAENNARVAASVAVELAR